MKKNSNLVNYVVPAYVGNYTEGRSLPIKKVTIHHMAGILSSIDCGREFQKIDRKGSATYGIGVTGDIAQYVSESDTPWTDSNFESNSSSITIEVSNSKTGGNWEVSRASMDSLIKLLIDVCKRNGIKKLIKEETLTWHSMYTATICPGNYLRSQMDYIASEVNKNLNIEELNTDNKENNEISNDELLEVVKRTIRGDFGNGQTRIDTLGELYGVVQYQVDMNYKNHTTNWDNIKLYL